MTVSRSLATFLCTMACFPACRGSGSSSEAGQGGTTGATTTVGGMTSVGVGGTASFTSGGMLAAHTTATIAKGGNIAYGGNKAYGGNIAYGGNKASGGSRTSAPSGGTSAHQSTQSTNPTSVYRPYSSSSPWNTLIGDNPAIDPDSPAMIADLEVSSPWGEHLDINIKAYSIPLYWVDASTPRVTVTCGVGGHGFVGTNGINATVQTPFLPGALPDPETDHHLLFVDRNTNTEYGFWNFTISGNLYTCGTGAIQDLNGDGVRPAENVASPWFEAHGPRACGYGAIAGLIRPEEVASGSIEHALVLGYPHIRSMAYTYPASTSQVTMLGSLPTRGIPCGGRIQYDPTIDVNGLNLSSTGRIVMRALQRYGAYVGDYSGAISLYADNSPDAKADWTKMGLGTNGFDDFMYTLRDVVDLADFRVLKLGTIHIKNP